MSIAFPETQHPMRRGYTQHRRPDPELAVELRNALTESSAFRNPDEVEAIQVTVEGGVAYLRGNTRTFMRALAANALAAKLPGIVEVKNELITDDEIDQAVTWALKHDERLLVENLYVETTLGRVQVRARLASPEQCALAHLITRRVAGVRSVLNEFELKPAHTSTPPVDANQQLSMRWHKPPSARPSTLA